MPWQQLQLELAASTKNMYTVLYSFGVQRQWTDDGHTACETVRRRETSTELTWLLCSVQFEAFFKRCFSSALGQITG